MNPDATAGSKGAAHPGHGRENGPGGPFVLRVGLTGGIATGKSTVARIFTELGATVVDADQIAHRLIDRGAAAYDRVVEAFGREILRENGSIDRSRLGRIVFADPDRRRLLESILHPMIHTEEAQRLEHQTARGSRIVACNAALLIETGSHRKYHRVVVVFCETAEQIERVMSRDRLSEAEARARIASQMPTEEKIRAAHYTIDTTPGFGATESRSRAVYRHLQFDLEALSRV